MSKHKKFNFGKSVIKPLGKLAKDVIHTPQKLLHEGVSGLDKITGNLSMPLTIGLGLAGVYLVYTMSQKPK